MDKELPELPSSGHPVHIRLTPSNLPGGENVLTASVTLRETINIEQLAANLKESGFELRKETLVMAYTAMNNEIYKALNKGYNVDFGIAKVELCANGHFAGIHDEFDKRTHKLTPNLRPSPRLRQLVAELPVRNVSPNFRPNGPHPERLWTNTVKGLPDNTFPGERAFTLFISGTRLKLMGELPGVGITLRNPETDERHFIVPNDVYPNQTNLLCFRCLPLHAGYWELTVGTQFTRTYRPYKTVHTGVIGFTVQET